MTEIKLSVLDRAVFGQLLLKNGKIVEMQIAKNLAEKVQFTSKEIEEFQLKDLEDGRTIWSKEKMKEVLFKFEDTEFEALKKGAELLDAGGQVTVQTLELILKIQNSKPKKEFHLDKV